MIVKGHTSEQMACVKAVGSTGPCYISQGSGGVCVDYKDGSPQQGEHWVTLADFPVRVVSQSERTGLCCKLL